MGTAGGHVPPSAEPRADALAAFLRREAGAISLSAEMTGLSHLVNVGLALLDAAALAEALNSDDPILQQLSEAGCFESMPQGRAAFLGTDDIRRAIRRPVSGADETGEDILHSIVVACGRP